jgi:hypothetical protein
MDAMEGGIIKQLESVDSTAGRVDLLVASQLINSKAVYDKALEALIAHPQKPTLDQAKRIGLDAYFAIVDQLTRCRYGSGFSPCGNPHGGLKRQCTSCSRWQ